MTPKSITWWIMVILSVPGAVAFMFFVLVYFKVMAYIVFALLEAL